MDDTYIHIVTSLMNIQIKIYESILNGMRESILNGKRLFQSVTLDCAAHATTSLLRQTNVRLNMRGLKFSCRFYKAILPTSSKHFKTQFLGC